MGEETTRACPHCDRGGLQYRYLSGHGDPQTLPADAHWYCGRCSTRVDDPIERQKRRPGDSGHTKLKRAGFDHLLDDGGDGE